MQNKDNYEDFSINWHEKSVDRPFYIDLEYEGRIYVDRETYLNYMRDEWREWKEESRKSRCQVPSEKGGLKRCTDDCSKCPFFRNGRNISLDQLYDNYEYEVEDESSDIIQKLIKDEKAAMIRKAVEELSPINKMITKKIIYEDKSQDEIAEILGISQTAVSKRYSKSLDQLKEKLSEYFNS